MSLKLLARFTPCDAISWRAMADVGSAASRPAESKKLLMAASTDSPGFPTAVSTMASVWAMASSRCSAGRSCCRRRSSRSSRIARSPVISTPFPALHFS